MQQFVIEISNYSKALASNFIIIPQNGIELAFIDANPEKGLHSGYLNAIQGLGIEELFYNGSYSPDAYRLSLLQQVKQHKKVMVSEYVSNTNDIASAYQINSNEGFLAFVRSGDNYEYQLIPDSMYNVNTSATTQLNEAANFLYLISTNHYTTKSDFINAIAATYYDIILIDLFFNDEPLTASDISALKTKPNGAQRLVLSYINIGAAENFRYYWKSDWKLHHPHWLKKRYEGYNEEYWVQYWNKEWKDIIFGNDTSYMKKIIDAGFDGAYLDNVEAYYFLYYND